MKKFLIYISMFVFATISFPVANVYDYVAIRNQLLEDENNLISLLSRKEKVDGVMNDLYTGDQTLRLLAKFPSAKYTNELVLVFPDVDALKTYSYDMRNTSDVVIAILLEDNYDNTEMETRTIKYFNKSNIVLPSNFKIVAVNLDKDEVNSLEKDYVNKSILSNTSGKRLEKILEGYKKVSKSQQFMQLIER